ncbi:MAG TPA: GGDEF domain-containing protein [Acidimicrobiia bacterium]
MSTAVLALGVQRLSDLQSQARDAEDELVRPAALLQQLADAQQQSMAAFQAAVSTDDHELQTTHLTDASTFGERGTRADKQYRRVAAGLPGERTAWARYDELTTVQTDAGRQAALALLNSPSASAPEVRHPADAYLTASGQKLEITTELEEAYVDRIETAVGDVGSDAGTSLRIVLIAFAIALAVALTIAGFHLRSALVQERQLEREDRARDEAAGHNAFEARIQRALEMSGTEAGSYRVLAEALDEVVPDFRSEVLVADSSRAHFRRVLGSDDGEGCGVTVPGDCPATRAGQTATFTSSSDLDACPFLKDRPMGACSATCVPLSIAGRAVGVVHVVGEDRAPPPQSTTVDVELIARRAGERIGLVRAFEASEIQAQTDPLTGLMNRRSFENRVREIVADGSSYTLAYADLDRFKDLNDTHGHDTGDRALRLFARVLRDGVRPHDLPARYGGEEFVIALPDCSVTDAVSVMERVREHLALAIGEGSVPTFTVSMGIAGAADREGLQDAMARADEALLSAKAQGRDRIVVAPSSPTDPSPVPLDARRSTGAA